MSTAENTNNTSSQTATKITTKKSAARKTTAKKNTATTITPKKQPGISKSVINEMSEEINNMISFAIFNGIKINTDINALVQNSNVNDLINAHNLLCDNVAPATPKSIQYTKKLHQDGKEKSLMKKLPLVRNLIVLALLFLFTFIGTGLSTHVNNDSLDKGIMSQQDPWILLLNLSFLASIAGLGVVFYLLKSVSTSVKSGTLIPEDAIYYVALIVLGLISGLIMSEIISLYTTDPNRINLFNKSLLALIGGFSSDAIFSVLQGLINKIKGLFPTS
ncbi:MAG: hypothetical protein HRT68_07320 [Flavobacteriaceae bacterium]|nr:hypothetical protein [Flavobacteriaceae bacterium]